MSPPSPMSDIDDLGLNLMSFEPETPADPVDQDHPPPIVRAEPAQPSEHLIPPSNVLGILANPDEQPTQPVPTPPSPGVNTDIDSLDLGLRSFSRSPSPKAPPDVPPEAPEPPPVVEDRPRWVHFRLPIPFPEDECTCGAHHSPPYVYYPEITPSSNKINVLPDELLYMTFMACVPPPSTPLDYFSVQASRLQIAHVVGQVCRRWREVVCSAPGFWCYASLPQRLNEASMLRMQTYLARVRDPHPLVVEFARSNAIAGEHAKLLFDQSRRWSALRLLPFVEPGSFFQFLGGSPGLPNLRRLELKQRSWQAMPQAPWGQLTHLSLECPMNGDSALELLDQCPRLLYLHLSWITGAPLAPPPEPDDDTVIPIAHVVKLPRLRTLSLSLDSTPAEFYERLQFPMLHTLTLSTPTSFSPPLDPALIDNFIIRSECTLRSFTLADSSMDSNAVIPWVYLLSLQSINHLRIQGTTTPDYLFDVLLVTDDWDAVILLPMLEDLEIDHFRSGWKMAAMARSRMRTGVFRPTGTIEMNELKWLGLKIGEYLRKQLQPEFLKLKKAGMNIKIEDRPHQSLDDTFLEPLDMDAFSDDPLW
ncbi:hypothetical protein ONZ45_g9086 [Pleurotus djamor]|nr:hypothetical protein ONZ45_g9086 [Pleurotus djamor]